MEEQKEINPEPYDAFITSSLFRFKFAIKWRVLRYVFRFDLHGEKCLPSKENVKPWFSGCYLIPTWRHWFTKRERQWLLIKTKWARRLLVFFTDQTRGEIDHAEQWTSVVNDAEGGNNGALGITRLRSASENARDRRDSVTNLQDEISDLLEDPAKMKKLTQEEFKKVLNIAVLPEVYPLYHDVIKAHFGMRLQSFRKSGRSLTLQSSVLCLVIDLAPNAIAPYRTAVYRETVRLTVLFTHQTHVLYKFPIPVCSCFQPKREVKNSERASRFLKLVYQEFGVRDVKEKANLEEEVHTLENVVKAMETKVDLTNKLILELFAKVTSLQEELSHRHALPGRN